MNSRKYCITLMSMTNGVTYHTAWVTLHGLLTESAIKELAAQHGINGNFAVLMVQELEA